MNSGRFLIIKNTKWVDSLGMGRPDIPYFKEIKMYFRKNSNQYDKRCREFKIHSRFQRPYGYMLSGDVDVNPKEKQ